MILEHAFRDRLRQAVALLKGLPDTAFCRKGHRRRLVRTLRWTLRFLHRDHPVLARKLLKHAIRRTDGCVLRGEPDPKGSWRRHTPDFVVDCTAQSDLYDLLTSALDAIDGG